MITALGLPGDIVLIPDIGTANPYEVRAHLLIANYNALDITQHTLPHVGGVAT
jgi:hypothetical protein